MRQSGGCYGQSSQIKLQEAIDASDVIGRWEYDVPNDRVRLDTLVAHIFNIDPNSAASGISINTVLSGIHPDDRLKTAHQFQRNAETGLCGVVEYRVCSSDGVIRSILDRGRITLDASGRAQHGSGILVDVTAARIAKQQARMTMASPTQNPLERAVEHSIAAHRAILELPESRLRLLSDMMLLEIGRMLARETDA